jgi:hypothetical protein
LETGWVLTTGGLFLPVMEEFHRDKASEHEIQSQEDANEKPRGGFASNCSPFPPTMCAPEALEDSR